MQRQFQQFLDSLVDLGGSGSWTRVLTCPLLCMSCSNELRTLEVSQMPFLDNVIDVFFVQFINGVDVPVIIHGRGLLSVLGKVVDMPVVFNDRCLVIVSAENCGFRSCSADFVVDVLVVQVVAWSLAGGASVRLSSSPELVDL